MSTGSTLPSIWTAAVQAWLSTRLGLQHGGHTAMQFSSSSDGDWLSNSVTVCLLYIRPWPIMVKAHLVEHLLHPREQFWLLSFPQCHSPLFQWSIIITHMYCMCYIKQHGPFPTFCIGRGNKSNMPQKNRNGMLCITSAYRRQIVICFFLKRNMHYCCTFYFIITLLSP